MTMILPMVKLTAVGRAGRPRGTARVRTLVHPPLHHRSTLCRRPSLVVPRAEEETTGEGAPPAPRAKAPPQQMLIYVPPHPLIKHWLAVARNSLSPPGIFRAAIAEMGRILIYEAIRDWLPTVQGEVETPCGVAPCEVADPSRPIAIVPVLRAGMLLLEQANTVIPHQATYHVGMVRDEETLKPTMYLNKLPPSFSGEDPILIAETMIATGGSVMGVIDEIVKRGANPANIRIISAVVAPPALQQLSDKYKGLKLYCAMIDEELNDQGFIVPGLGDAGDRAYGTFS